MNTEIEHIGIENVACGNSREGVLERLERLKTMAHIMEAQLVDRMPVLAELASNLADEIDGIADRIHAEGI